MDKGMFPTVKERTGDGECAQHTQHSGSSSVTGVGSLEIRNGPASNGETPSLPEVQPNTQTPLPSMRSQQEKNSRASLPKLYHASSIQEEREHVETNLSDQNPPEDNSPRIDSYDGGGLTRLSSYGVGGIPQSQFKIDADSSVVQQGGLMGSPVGLQGWDGDGQDLPVGQGGPSYKRKLCILSLDGGGMRGLIAARILAHLENMIQEKIGGGKVNLCEYFDLLAGTSTGAILTTMLVTPDANGDPLFTAEGCCNFYKNHGRFIFQSKWYDCFHGSMRQLYRPKYSARRFENLLKLYTVRDGRELTLVDTLKPILVTSFDISQATPFFFVRQAALNDPSRNFRLWEVCRATAAAPTYFPPAYVASVDGKVKGTLIDGGSIQNNPALIAMTHAMSNKEEFPYAHGLEDTLMLSLGAGQLDQKHELGKASKWGMTGWVRPIMNIMMDGSADTVDYQLAAAYAGNNCSENYLRIQLSGLPNKTALMDCTSQENIHDLIAISDDLLKHKAVMRNTYGEKVTLEETHAERLSWFADQLIIQKKLREEGPKEPEVAPQALPQYIKEGLGPASRLVSPLFAHLFEHHKHTDLAGHAEKARSFRF